MVIIRIALGSVACLGVFVSGVLLLMVPYLSPSRVAAVALAVMTLFFFLLAIASALRLVSRAGWVLGFVASAGPIVTFALLPMPSEADRVPFLFVTGAFTVLWWIGMLIDRGVSPEISSPDQFGKPDDPEA